jgi:site-specific DNA-methyltransferase (adenine-specific)
MPPKPRRKPGTRTSAFGSTGRISHDASTFYQSRLYKDLYQEQKLPYQETDLPEQVRDHVLRASAEDMQQLPDHSIHLMVTSPPYNVGKDYDEDLTLKEYLDFLSSVFKEVYRVLVPGGRACINIANLGRKPYLPLNAFIVQIMLDLNFLMRGEIIWNKAASVSPSTAWGSWLSAANPTLRDVHEYILVFSKVSFKRLNPAQRPATITKEDFLECSKSVWTFPTESARKIGHPAPFPLELPRRLIELYTFAEEVVLDPFMGSGQTALAALASGRHFVGYEINTEYALLAEERILQAKS